MSVSLHDLILRSARAQLAKMRTDGSAPPGRNGPHEDVETPVRNTSHWLVTFSRAYEWTGDEGWREAAARAAGYLKSGAARPSGAAFHHRVTTVKDETNGLIGPAWSIEALVEGARALADGSLLTIAHDVAKLHRFDSARGLWSTSTLDGRESGIDLTFNHQLWFAAAVAQVAEVTGDQHLTRDVESFIAKLGRNLRLTKHGYVRHMCRRLGSYSLRGWAGIVRHPIREWHRFETRRRMEPGYHGFNLYGLGMLARTRVGRAIREEPTVMRAVETVANGRLRNDLEDNPFGYGYNPAGFEVAFGLCEFRSSEVPGVAEWVGEQFRRHWDKEADLLRRSTADPVTLAARIYEATRLPDLVLDRRGW